MALATGDRLGPYDIRSKIGSGGMGEVYLADDTRLKRRVAIKVLAADSIVDDKARPRLVREAQAAAALDHPNICSIYEVGEHQGVPFIVMQYLDGETLAARLQRKRLTVAEAIDVAMPVAEALGEAHTRGIVHRDIKPHNIMLTARGPKILDFGLAKPIDPGAGDVDTRSLLTQAGTISGTAPYMSPEQVRGEPLDARSDIFSFGVVLYEMLSAQRLFGAGSTAEVISAVLTREPEPLTTHGVSAPPGIERVLRRCLHKDRAQRYHTMREVLLELESVRREPQSQAVVADRPARMRPRFSSRLVGAALVISGSLAAGMYGLLTWTPTGGPARGVVDSPAYELYLRGKVHVGSESRENNDQAIQLLHQAVAADANFAPAHALLARAYHVKAFYYASETERKTLIEDAEVAVEKALGLDPKLGEAYLSRGLLLWTHGNRFPHEQAAQSFKQAIALDPKLDEAHHQLALVYFHVGLLEQGWTEVEKALAVNPANMTARMRLGVIDLYRGRYQSALDIFNSTPLQRNPAILSFQKATALFQLGRHAEAEAVVDDYLRTQPADEGGTVTSVKAMLLAKAGKAQEAEQTVQQAMQIGKSYGHFHHTAYNIAVAYALMNQPDDAIRWLEAAADDGFPCYPLFESDRNLDSLRQNPRFIAFMMQLKARWQRFQATL